MKFALGFSAVILLFGITAQANLPPVLDAARQRIEASDFRASGRLIRTDANGNRVSVPITLEAHWFPGVLRELIEVSSSKSTVKTGEDTSEKILLEMRPGGESTIRVFHRETPEPALLPFEKWSEGVAGGAFSYEDFLDAEYYWQGQTLLKTAKIGSRDCDVIKSTPGRTDRSHYSQVQTWLDTTIAYPIYVEKTPKDGAAVKTFTSLGIGKSGGVSYARQVEVKVQGRPGSTVLLVERGSAKAHLTLKDFSINELSRF